MSEPQYCQFTWTQVKESGFLSPERISIIEQLILNAQRDVLTEDGKVIKNVKSVTGKDGTAYMYRTQDEYAQEYMVRHILPLVLTPEEFSIINNHCLEYRGRQRDKERFDKAQKIPADQWAGDVWSEDAHYPSVDDYLSMTDDEDQPEYIWAAESREVAGGVHLHSLLENCMESDGWEDMDIDDFDGVEALEAAVAAFIAANKETVSYWPDYTKAIILPKQEPKQEPEEE